MTQIRPEDEVVSICQELIRIDSSNYGDGSGSRRTCRGRIHRRPDQRGGAGRGNLRIGAGPGQRGHPHGGGGPLRKRPRGPRPPGRGARPPGAVVCGPVWRRTQGRADLGPRRGGHEGHGRHDPVRPAGLCPHRPQAEAGHHLRVLRGRGSRRRSRLPVRGEAPARAVRGGHRGHLGGGRILRHHRRPAHVPPPDGGEGHLVAAPRGPRPRRPRVPDQHGQRHYTARRRRDPHRRVRVAHRADGHHTPVPRRRDRTDRRRV